ncbi:NUDIX domain-containing protein [Streptomyces sp. NPDC005574]|uniref:NUDIX domain-containing protein n=1 Tax=Streptomyces sp. NPDC005574 TaxID=3156891 RepID=UPI0033A63498
MTSPVSPSDHVARHAALAAAPYASSRHAVWVGAAAIVTDQVGRVPLVHPTHHQDDRWLLPGGVVEPGEQPHVTCRREITEELGLAYLPLSGVLAVHSLSPRHPDIQPGASCPGEIRYVFDGGTLTPDQVEAIRLPRDELSEFAFLETRDAVERLRPVDGQIMLAAYRARLGNTATAHLADGRHILDIPLDRHDVHVSYRSPCGTALSIAAPSPSGSPCSKPGRGASSPTAGSTLHREAAEEAQLTLTDPVRLGWVLDETGEVYGRVGPNARLGLAARVTDIGPATVDPSPATPSHACSPPQPKQPPYWDGARQERGKPCSPQRQLGNAGACPPLPATRSRKSPRRGCG